VGILLAVGLATASLFTNKPGKAEQAETEKPKKNPADANELKNVQADLLAARAIALVDENGKIRMTLGMEDEQPCIALQGKHKGSLRLGFYSYKPKSEDADQAYLSMGSEAYDEELRIGAGVGGTSIMAHSSTGHAATWFSSDPDGHTFLSMSPNGQSQAYAQYVMSAEGKPAIRLVDQNGNVVFDTDEAGH
jgi:hypothetical protein